MLDFSSIPLSTSAFFSSCQAYSQGLPLVVWLYSLTGSCVYGNLAAVSWSTSFISVVCWVVAELYQVFVNYQSKDLSGFSLAFLVAWLLGDIANLAACLLTNQMVFQILLAWWYLTIDTILLGQYIYYTRYYTDLDNAPVLMGEVQPYYDTQYDDYGRTDNLSKCPTTLITIATTFKKTTQSIASSLSSSHGFASPIPTIPIPSQMSPASSSNSAVSPNPGTSAPRATPLSLKSKLRYAATAVFFASKSLALPIAIKDSVQTLSSAPLSISTVSPPTLSWIPSGQGIGILAAWVASLLYFASRIPQIHKTYTRKSTAGMGMGLFIADFIGNSTFVIAIVAKGMAMPDNDFVEKSAFWSDEMPYILGNTLSVLGDIVIFYQAWYYNRFYPDPDSGFLVSKQWEIDYHNSDPSQANAKLRSELTPLITENRYSSYI